MAKTAPSEGCTVLIADEATGENPPLFTPPKDFFATVSYDTDAGYLSNRVAIGSPATGQLLYKVDRFAPGTGPIRIDEVESTHLRVRYSRSPYSAAPPHDRTGSFSIWRHNGIWRVDSTTSEALGQDQRESSL